jgi:hypothetical protein
MHAGMYACGSADIRCVRVYISSDSQGISLQKYSETLVRNLYIVIATAHTPHSITAYISSYMQIQKFIYMYTQVRIRQDFFRSYSRIINVNYVG